MAGLMTELTDTMAEYADCCEGLAALALEKKDAVIRNEVELLRDVVARENELVGKAQRLEKRRAALFGDIAVVLNKPTDGLTLDELCNIVEGQPESVRLRGVTKRLRVVMADLKAANDHNRALIDNALAYIEFSVNVLRTTFVDEAHDYSETSKGIDIRN